MALGRQIPVLVIRLGADPHGFPGKTQWPSLNGQNTHEVGGRIAAWINSLPQYSDGMVGRLLDALREAGNYYDAGAAAQALNAFDALTADQFDQLDAIYMENGQVHGSVLAHRGLDPLYARHDRSYPERN